MQMQAQQQLIKNAQEEAKATTATASTSEVTDKMNVLDIKVEDDFEIDDI